MRIKNKMTIFEISSTDKGFLKLFLLKDSLKISQHEQSILYADIF